jgi:hypothetical protein
MQDKDVLIHLMEAYKVTKDPTFVACMAQKYERVMYFNDPDSTVDAVMELAEQVYTDRLNSGEWAKPSRDQEKIVILEAQLKQLSTKPGKGKKGKDSSGKSDDKNYSYEPEQAWKWEPPAKGDPTIKTVKNARFHWCPNHQHRITKSWGMWARHQPSECKAPSRPSATGGPHPVPPTRTIHALNTIIEHAHDDDDDDCDYSN